MVEALNLILIGSMLQSALCQFMVAIPKSIEVLTGSCVTIPCTFQIPLKFERHLDQTCKAIWRKTTGDKVFDSRFSARKVGNLRGILTEKDCTTTLNKVAINTGDYHFRLECLNELKADFKNIILKILVTDDPPIPTLSPSALRQKEKTTVMIKCSAVAPCLSQPPNLTWTPRLGKILESMGENESKTKVITSTLSFTTSHVHHRQEISCNALYSRQNGRTEATSRSLTLNISFAPQILPSSNCTQTADQLHCSCETVGNPSPAVEWYLDGSPVSHSDKFAISKESLNDTGLRTFITMKPQKKDLSSLLCHSSNSVGSASQRFYIYSFQPQILAESQECSNQVVLPVLIVTIGLLTAGLVCALLFAIRAQRTVRHNPTNNQCSSDSGTAVMSRGLASVKGNKGSITSEEDIYVNVMGQPHKFKTYQGHEQVASKSTEKSNEEGGDVIYSSVILSSKKMKKKPEHFVDGSRPGSSGLEICMAGGRRGNVVSNGLEMGRLYDNTVAGKDANEEVYSNYSTVNFKDKNITYK